MNVCTNAHRRLAAAAVMAAATTLAVSHSHAQSVIWDNGPLITQPNGGCPADPNPHNDSELQNVAPINANTLGFTMNAPTFRVADNFTILGATTVSSITAYCYQTFAAPPTTFPPASTITSMVIQIWNGRPGDAGSVVVFGDTTTNRLTTTTFSGIYRSAAAGAGIDLCVRPLMANTAVFTPAIALPAGTYWIEYGFTGTLAGTPFGPPVTLPGAWQLGNARQLNVATATWVNASDGGNGLQGDLPFIVRGNACALPLSCFCAADIAPAGGNSIVNVDDLLTVINGWGQDGTPQGPRPQADTAPLPNGDCKVNVDDLLGVINAWGACPPAVGSCCFDDGTCLNNQTAAACAAAEGTYNGNCTTCAAVFCPIRPLNNKCSTAQLVTAPTTPWSNAFATTDGPTGTPGNGCEDQMTRDIWFNYQATQTGAVVIDTVGSTGNTDTMLAVYDTWACPPTSLLGCNDDIGGTPAVLASRLTIPVVNGQQLKIRVSSFASGAEGAGVLNIGSFDNDICGGALQIGVPSTTPGTLSNATIDSTALTCDGVPPGTGKWYTVEGTGETLTAHTCDGPAEIWDGQITVYCGNNCADLTCIAGVDGNSCNFFQESVSWCSTAGQTYWILVHSDDGPSDGNYVLTVSDGAKCGGALACGCFQCPIGGIAEGEPCATAGYIDATNGGCNSTPAVFGSITANGPAICGLGSTFVNGTANIRDTDWYTFTVTIAGTYRVQISSSFTATAAIVTNTALDITQCGAGQAFVAGSTVTTTGDPCVAALTSTGVTLQPGTYAVFVGSNVFTGQPCTVDDVSNKYWVRLLNP